MTKKTTKQQPEDDLMADLQRVQADFINYKRRAEEERAQAVAIGREDVIQKLLPVIDNLERALGHLPKELEKNDWAKGVQSVSKQIEQTLNALGLQRIESLGADFDHNLHEAVAVDGEGAKELVAEELRPGYSLNGVVIRPAMVKVRRES